MVLLSTGFEGAPNQSLTLAWPLYFISHEVLLNRSQGRHSPKLHGNDSDFQTLLKCFWVWSFVFGLNRLGF